MYIGLGFESKLKKIVNNINKNNLKKIDIVTIKIE